MNCRTQKLKNPGLLDSGTPMFEKQVWKKLAGKKIVVENCTFLKIQSSDSLYKAEDREKKIIV